MKRYAFFTHFNRVNIQRGVAHCCQRNECTTRTAIGSTTVYGIWNSGLSLTHTDNV